MLRVELFKASRRWRTYLMGAALGGIPVILVISLLLSQGPASGDDGPPFYALITRNGFFAPLAALGALQVFLLPLTAGLLSGDAVAGEASLGTLRYLLVRPVGRARLVAAKYGCAVILLTLLVTWVEAVGLTAGGLAYGLDSMPTLSGTVLGAPAAVGRIGLAGAYIVSGMAGLAAVGVFASVLTDSAPGATVATVGLAIVSQILDSLSALRAIHPFLISHRWLAFVDLFRAPVAWTALIEGLILHASYAALFLAAAVLAFRRRDVHN
jgi:ABC-2 type transport system permease protein